jgi:hypothetical protein
MSGKDGAPIQVKSRLNVDALPAYVEQLLVVVANGGELSDGLRGAPEKEVEERFLELVREANGDGDNVR